MQLLARVILELAHGQPPAPRGRAPVHAAQRLADLVVAHAREPVARARGERAARAVALRERARARRAELDELRLDAQPAGGGERDARADEAEHVLEHELGRELVAPARRIGDTPASVERRARPEPGRRGSPSPLQRSTTLAETRRGAGSIRIEASSG